MSWSKNDLKIMELRDEITLLNQEFDNKHGKDIKDYHKKLNKFLNKRMQKQADSVIKEQIMRTLSIYSPTSDDSLA